MKEIMDANYFKDQICEELEGAKCYVMNAIEIKGMNSDWGKMFLEMSAAELDHAAKLWKMFDQYYKIISDNYKAIPDYIEQIHKEVSVMYAEKSSMIRYMHEMYNK